MNGNKFGSPEERAKIELLDSFFKRFGKEFREALGEVLSNARTNEVLQLPQEANCIVRVELVGSATIKFDSPNGREVDLVKTRKLKGFTFKRIYISNDAISGGHLLLLIGKGDFDIEFEKASLGEINNYDILTLDLEFARADAEFQVNARAIQLLEKSNDNWSVKLNSNKNPSISGSYIDPGDIIQGDGAMPAYIPKIYFTNQASPSGSVKFLISRDLPFRSLTGSEVYLEVDPESDPTYPPSSEFPDPSIGNWVLVGDIGVNVDIVCYLGAGKIIVQDSSTYDLYRSSDYGKSWSMFKNIGHVRHMAYSQQEDALYACVVQPGDNKLKASYDHGNSWVTKLSFSGWKYDVCAGAIVINSKGTAYFVYLSESTNNYNIRVWNSETESVTHLTGDFWGTSDVRGGSWVYASKGFSTGILYVQFRHKNSLDDYRNDCWLSTDDGASWSSVSGFNQSELYAIDRVGSVYLKGKGDGTIRKSTDCINWTDVADLGNKIYTICHYSGSNVLAGISGSTGAEIWLSDDSGDSWSRVADGSDFPGSSYIRKIIRASDSVLLAITNDGKVYQLTE